MWKEKGGGRKEGKGREVELTLADREVVFFSTSSPPVFPDFPFPPVDILGSKGEEREESQLKCFEEGEREGEKVELLIVQELKGNERREREDV